MRLFFTRLFVSERKQIAMIADEKSPARISHRRFATSCSEMRIIMNKIASFTVNHLDLLTGVYVSRKDYIGDVCLTTFDLRFTRPNEEPPMDTPGIHSIEHLVATFLRNHAEWAEKTIYFGPMGCRTGCYLLLKGRLEPKDILDLIKRLWKFISTFEGEIPGAAAKDCGNYLDQNLPMARYEAKKYLEKMEKFTESNLAYPE